MASGKAAISGQAMSEFSAGTALVIGGSGGLGAAICRSLGEAGSHVCLTYRSNRDAAAAVVRAVESNARGAKSFQCDMADAQSVKAAVDAAIAAFGHIHSVVYAAGPKIEFMYINEITPSEWARVMAADVNGCFNLIWAILPHFRERKMGSIVALVTAAVDRSPPRDILSAAPKAAIQMLVRGVAREEGRSGIRANCVGPGFIEAGLGVSTVHAGTTDYVSRMTKAIPLKRIGSADEVADVVVFLLSERARYISGETISVAGGLQLA
jgi:NAD(P)-dependent dehydrogenase (short-subunit alcohol dehydrogenase family)